MIVRSKQMARTVWTQEAINNLNDAQRHSLIKAGLLTIEATEAEEQLWQVCMVMLDRMYIAELLGLSVTTVNTYMGDHYRLCKMKEKLFTVLGASIRQRDIAVVHNLYKKLNKVVEERNATSR
jgi:hypothetical protein